MCAVYVKQTPMVASNFTVLSYQQTLPAVLLFAD